jgi:DNA-binding HxlR family transcriptional regulator
LGNDDRAAVSKQPCVYLKAGWKLVILFHLFGGKIMRFSDFERAIPNITQKMLGRQLKSMQADGIVHRTAYP